MHSVSFKLYHEKGHSLKNGLSWSLCWSWEGYWALRAMDGEFNFCSTFRFLSQIPYKNKHTQKSPDYKCFSVYTLNSRETKLA